VTDTNEHAPAKTRDVRHAFRGTWTGGGVCRVRIDEAPDRPPVFVLTELDENTTTSVNHSLAGCAYSPLSLLLDNTAMRVFISRGR
jgi:hypothetical protein